MAVYSSTNIRPSAVSALLLPGSTQETPATSAQRAETAFLSQTILRFPRVPIFDWYPHGVFYVRDCFLDYYDAVIHQFTTANKRGVSVCGAPGVGTSVFLAYFILRYQLQYPSNTIVFISYDACSNVQQAMGWKNGKVVEKLYTDEARCAQDRVANDPDAIFLLNGPPQTVPTSEHRYVTFSSPSK